MTIFLGATLAFAQPTGAQQPTPGAAPPVPGAVTGAGGRLLPSMPAPPGAAGATRPQPTQATGTPAPASGDRQDFSYAPSSDHEGVTVVYPADGEPVLVPSNFMQSSLKSGANDQQILQDAKMFEQMNSRVAEQFASSFFPDESAGTANVPKSALQGKDRDVIIEQDPDAGPYARVTVTDKQGNVISQGSVSAKMAQQILANTNMDVDKRIDALTRGDFQLPEQARQNFNNLSAAELLAIVAEKPELQEKSFIKMTKVFAEEKAKREASGQQTTAPVQRKKNAAADAAQTSGHVSRTGISEEDRRNSPKPLDADKFSQAVKEPKSNGLELPEIIGIVLGLGALGIFIFGLLKTRRG